MYNSNMFDFIKKGKKTQDAKKLILKEYFNSGNQKKVITQAARKSAEDQNILLAKYQKLANS